MLKREGYTKRMERNLTGWQTRFQTRRAEAASRGAALSPDSREQLEASKVGGDAAFAKLAELRAVTARYVELRDEMDELWKAIDDTPREEVAVADAPAAAAGDRPRRARGE